MKNDDSQTSDGLHSASGGERATSPPKRRSRTGASSDKKPVTTAQVASHSAIAWYCFAVVVAIVAIVAIFYGVSFSGGATFKGIELHSGHKIQTPEPATEAR